MRTVSLIMVSGAWIPKGLRKGLSFSSSQHQQLRIRAKSNPTECIRILQIYYSTGNHFCITDSHWCKKKKTKLCPITDGMVNSRQAWQSTHTMHMMLTSFFVAFWASTFACRFKKKFSQNHQLHHVGAVQSRLDYSHSSGVTIVQDIVIFKRMAQQNALFITAGSL